MTCTPTYTHCTTVMCSLFRDLASSLHLLVVISSGYVITICDLFWQKSTHKGSRIHLTTAVKTVAKLSLTGPTSQQYMMEILVPILVMGPELPVVLALSIL